MLVIGSREIAATSDFMGFSKGHLRICPLKMFPETVFSILKPKEFNYASVDPKQLKDFKSFPRKFPTHADFIIRAC